MQHPDRHFPRAESLAQFLFEFPLRAWNAAEQIQAERGVFWKRVARQVRFRKQAQAGNAAASRELMPYGRSHRSKLQIGYQGIKQ
jgi:hypothetical protein